MDGCFAGPDVSRDETAVRVRCADGAVALARKVETDPDAICAALATPGGGLSRAILAAAAVTLAGCGAWAEVMIRRLRR